MNRKMMALLVAFVMLAGALFTGCAGGGGKEESKIGVFGPLTGTMAIGGTHQKDGVQFAIDEINEAGGVLGHKLAGIYEDTEGNAQNAVNIMNKFLHKDNVTVTIGSNNSPEVLAVLDMIQTEKTPHIVPSGVASAITASGCEWVFRITATDVVYAKTLVEQAADNLGCSKIAIIHDTNDYGQGGLKLVEENLKLKGLEAVAVEGYTTGTKDFSPSLMKFKAAGADAIIVWGNYTEGAQIVRQIRELEVPGEVLLSTGATIGNFFELAGDAADNLYGVSSGFNPQRKDEAATSFIEKFEAKMGYVPDVNVTLGYDAVMVFAEAVKQAGKVDKEAIRDAMFKIQNFQAVSGPVSFQSNGEGGTAAIVFKIVGGETELIQ